MALELVSVGVNTYDDERYANLSNAVRDAAKIAAFFETSLPLGSRFHACLLENPTSPEVHRALESALKALDDDSIFVFYFAGHALQDKNTGVQSLLFREAFGCLADGFDGSGALNTGYFNSFKARARGKLFFCYDACRCEPLAGRATDSGLAGQNQFRDAASQPTASTSGRRAQSWTLLSCAAGERASDDGSFANALIETIRNRIDYGEEVYLGDALVSDLTSALRTRGRDQTPDKSGADFTLVPGKKGRSTSESDLARRVRELEEQLRRAQTVVVPEPSKPISYPKAPGSREAGERMTLKIRGVEYAFRWIPAGSFTMGSPKGEQEAAIANLKAAFGEEWGEYKDGVEMLIFGEVQHKVNISRDFWLLESPITQCMWSSVMGGNPSKFRGSDRLPVEQISWNDCQEYIGKLNGLGVCPEGFRFSLPTEAEWEYACRAGATTAYSFGNALNGDKANCDGNCPYGTDKKRPYLDKTTEVGKYPANAWGLVDMHGNVCEWVQDWYGDYPTGEVTDPTGPEGGSGRVFRGGCWDDYAVLCRAAGRCGYDPDGRDVNVGSRLVLRPLG